MDADGLAVCLIRLEAGTRTDPYYAGLPNDRCQCAHWGYIIAGTVRVHDPNNTLDYEAGQAYYWEPGHNIEAVIDAEYVEISRAADYDILIAHCRRGISD